MPTMKITKPTSLSLFQLFAAWVLVAIITCPGDAMHHGPMLIFKSNGLQGGGGAMAAAGVLAAGLAFKLFSDMGKGHGGGYNGGYAPHNMGAMHSFGSHDANLGQYGYTPEMHGGWMRR